MGFNSGFKGLMLST